MLALAAVSWPATARAAPFDLAWSAPDGCPSREEIVEATRARLGESPAEVAPEFFVRGAVSKEDGRFVITLAMKDASGRPAGERRVRVDAESCAEVERPTSLVLAMMIAVAHSAPPAVSSETSPPAETSPPSEAALPPARAPSAEPSAPLPAAPPTAPPGHSHRLRAGAAGAVSHGVLPDVGLGFAIHMTYALRSLSLGLEGRFEDGGRVTVGRAAVGFHLLGIGARLGVTALRAGRLELIPFVTASVARISSSATGVRASYELARTTGLVGPGVLSRFALTRSLSVELSAEGHCVLLRDRFAVRSGDELIPLHRPSAFAPRISLGIGYEF